MTMLSHFAASGGAIPVYIEDVFSTWLYTGNGSTQTITTGIDTGTKGGLIWVKMRDAAASHSLFDSTRASGSVLSTNTTDPASGGGSRLALTSTGFDLQSGGGGYNQSGSTYASWTFRKQPKFFDVVTWTGNSTANRAIAHNLGSTPGCIIVKKLDSAVTNTPWCVWHRSLADINAGYFAYLNTTDPYDSGGVFNVQLPTSTEFYVGNNLYSNYAGSTYVAYVFAHNAGGFGLTGTDNVISCGSFTTDGSGNATVNLGYEPQWIMVKKITAGDEANSGHWWMQDNMRGYPVRSGNSPYLQANTSQGEVNPGPVLTYPTSTGFVFNQNYAGFQSVSFIYIAIRRGPMKTPTSGTSVLAMSSQANNTTYPYSNVFNAGFPPDWAILKTRDDTLTWRARPRLTGNQFMAFPSTAAESTQVTELATISSQNELPVQSTTASAATNILYAMRRAPGFFDVVCYTGTGTTKTQAHNLGVAPELIIVKRRNDAAAWQVYSATYGRDYYAFLNLTQGFASDPGNSWGTTNPTSTTFSLSPLAETNASGSTYVAHLFASCPGVSKVGSYTGNGSSQTIDCGFTSGARFVLIKAASATGGWIVFDSARGITGSSDPFLVLNSTAAESGGFNYVDASASGFTLASASLNNSGVNYIFLAIA